MKCPWQTTTTRHAPTKDGAETVTVTFGDCFDEACHFFCKGHTYGADGEPVEVQKCTRTDTAERRPI